MESIDKRYFVIGLAVLLIVVILSLIFFATRPVRTESTVSVRPAQLVSTQIAQTPQATPTLVATQVVEPAKPPLAAGSIWVVYQIVYQAHHIETFSYDVATFTNIETRETLTAHCAEPSWPSPPLGTKYRLNSIGVLIPLTENANRPYQRFILLEY